MEETEAEKFTLSTGIECVEKNATLQEVIVGTPLTQEEYIRRYPNDRFVVWRRHEELVFDGNGKDFIEGTDEADLKLRISTPINVGPNLRVLTLVAAREIWFYYHHAVESLENQCPENLLSH